MQEKKTRCLQEKGKIQFLEHKIWGTFKSLLHHSYPIAGKRLYPTFSIEQKEILGIQAWNTLSRVLTAYFELVLLISIETGMSRELTNGRSWKQEIKI